MAPCSACRSAFRRGWSVPSGSPLPFATNPGETRQPTADFVEGIGEYKLLVEVPGATRESLEVLPGPAEGTLSLKVVSRGLADGENVLRGERGGKHGRVRFERILPVAWDADISRVRSELSEGLLTIVVPKRASRNSEPSKRDVA